MRRQITFEPLIIAAAIAGLSAGCLEMEMTDDELAGMIGEEHQEAYVLTTNLWLASNISVCWENPGSFTTERQWVREAIEDTWEKAAAIDFIGWDAYCPTNGSGLRIRIADTGAHVVGLGNALDGVANGMTLNFTFNNWYNDCKEWGEDVRRDCIKSIAVHEFGHAIGFAHEHNRSDTPDSCTEPHQGTYGDQTLGEWDADSVMNYCNGRRIVITCTPNFPDFWNQTCTGTGPSHHLSDTDAFAAAYFFGTTRFGVDAHLQIAYHDKCVDVQGGNSANGTTIQQWECQSGNTNQIFRLEPYNGHYRIKHQATGKCLDILAAGTTNGARVGLWECTGTPWQEFTLVDDTSTEDKSDFHFVSRHSGKCLDLKWGGSQNGTEIHQWSCGAGNPAQLFRVRQF